MNSFATRTRSTLIEKIGGKQFLLKSGPTFEKSAFPTIFSVVCALFEGCMPILLEDVTQKIKDEVCPKRKTPPEVDEPTLWGYFACFLFFSLFQRTRIENFWGKNRKTTRKDGTNPKKGKGKNETVPKKKKSDQQSDEDPRESVIPENSSNSSNSSLRC